MTQDYSVRNLGRSAFWSVINQGLGQFLVFFVFLVTARFVSKEEFGIMAMAMLSIELFRQILIESVATCFYARKSPLAEDYNAGFMIIFAGGASTGLLVFLLAQPIAEFFGHANIATTLRWISALLLTAGLSKMHEIWLTKHLQFRALALRSIVSIGIGGTVGIGLAINGYGITSLIAQQIITAVIAAIWLWRASTWRPSLEFQWQHVAGVLHYGKFVSLNATASFFAGQGDVLLSSLYLGPGPTGVYSAAKRLLTAVALIVDSGLNSVALPALASVSDHEKKLAQAYLTGVGLTAMLSAPLYAGLAVLSPDIIALLMGDKWSDAAPILAILSIIGFNRTITQYSINILLIRQKAHWQTILGFCDAALNITLLTLVARYGLIYLAGSFVVKTLILSPIINVLALSLLKLGYLQLLRRTALPIALALLTGALIAYARSLGEFSAVINLVIFIPAGAGLYLLLHFLFGRASLRQAHAFLLETLK
jgi:O-antigen/teichoic acid export membrane protein